MTLKGKTAEAGRIRCAKDLAEAEVIGQRLDYQFEWDWDAV
jgi:hypothetical protein